MFTKEINGKQYGLIRVPDDSTGINVTPAQEPGYVWICNAAGIRKRVELSLDEWSVVSNMNEISDTTAYPTGLMALVAFIIESGLKESNALLLVKSAG